MPSFPIFLYDAMRDIFRHPSSGSTNVHVSWTRQSFFSPDKCDMCDEIGTSYVSGMRRSDEIMGKFC